MESHICPSLLSCDFARLGEEANGILKKGADWLHVDVMDGHFVNNLTLGAPIVKCLRKVTTGFLDCHLMVSNPEKWVEDFAAAGANQFVFHIEATQDAGSLIKRVKETGMKVGIAVKPKTTLEDVLPHVPELDMVLIMTVEPGFGGQSFMDDMMPKVNELRTKFPALNIQVDGGLSPKTIDIASAAGANCIVAGSAIFGAEDPSQVITALRNSVESKMKSW